MAELHLPFVWAVVVLNGAAGLWVSTANWVETARRREMWWFVIATQVVTSLQVAFSMIVNRGDDPAVADFNPFYGALVLMSIGILFSYRQQVHEHLYLLYGLGSLWIMGLTLRTILF